MPETAAPPHDPDLDAFRLGSGDFASALGGVFEYHPNGGRCTRRACKADAPWVKLGPRKVKLPCSTHAAEDTAAEEAADREASVYALMLDSGRTERMKDWSFETYESACSDKEGMDALLYAKRWVKTYLDTGAAPNMLMWGPVGCGKTGLAWSMTRALIEEGRRAKLVNFAALLEGIKDCYARKVPTTRALEVNRLPVLVLDDLGAERPTEWACGELLGIVNYRYERGMPTIYISNYPPKALAERLGRHDPVIGERIVSRMSEGAMKFDYRGADRRLAA